MRDDDEVTEIEPTGTTAERPDSSAQQPPPSVSLSLPLGAVTSCRGMVFRGIGRPGGPCAGAGPRRPTIGARGRHGRGETRPGTARTATRRWRSTFRPPGLRISSANAPRPSRPSGGEATLWYAPYGLADAVQIRVPTSFSPPCNLWDITVRGPDQAANRALAIETATPRTSGAGG